MFRDSTRRARAPRLRVVVADNDGDALDLVCTDLVFEGHAVMAARSGEEALVMVREFAPDVLVVDYRMAPGPSGLDVLRTLRSEQRALQVIVYSNYRDERVVAEVRALGATFLTKGGIRDLRKAVSAAGIVTRSATLRQCLKPVRQLE